MCDACDGKNLSRSIVLSSVAILRFVLKNMIKIYFLKNVILVVSLNND